MAGFREACQRRGVDPHTGATSYQVALYKAEQAKAKARRHASHWWAYPWLWRDPGYAHSSAEQVVLQSIFIQALHARIEREARRAARQACRAG